MSEDMTPIDAWSAWRAVGVAEGRKAEGINWTVMEELPGPTAVNTIVNHDCDGRFCVVRGCNVK